MGCSINIIRRPDPKSEVRYVGEPIDYYYDDEEDLDVKFLITNLYEKIGELKRRIEVLENERS